MPKRQFLFSVVFGFGNSTQEIFSELDETKAHGPIFHGGFQNIEKESETPALEASCIIESLVGIPPVNEAKIEMSLEDVKKKLEAIEKNLPSVETKLGILLDNTVVVVNEQMP